MRAERRDANEAEIIAALREAGCEVWQLCAKEPADLLVLSASISGYDADTWQTVYARNYMHLLEIKDSAKPPSARKLTAKQVETHKRWPVIVVEDVQQALQAVRGGV